MAVRIYVIEISDHVRAKINGRHGLTEDDVIDACERYEQAVFDQDDRGRRLLLRGRTRSGRTVRIVLYPVDEAAGTWRLVTAFP